MVTILTLAMTDSLYMATLLILPVHLMLTWPVPLTTCQTQSLSLQCMPYMFLIPPPSHALFLNI